MARTERNYGPFDWMDPILAERDGYLHNPGQGQRRRSARKVERAQVRNAMQRGDYEAALIGERNKTSRIARMMCDWD